MAKKCDLGPFKDGFSVKRTNGDPGSKTTPNAPQINFYGAFKVSESIFKMISRGFYAWIDAIPLRILLIDSSLPMMEAI